MSQEPPSKRRRITEEEEDPTYVEDAQNESESDADIQITSSRKTTEDDGGPYYDASKEKPPSHPVFDDSFQEVKDKLENVLSRVEKQLAQSDHKHLAKLKSSFGDISKVPSLKRLRIALVGQPGSGKSSLINSLLDCEDLADTGASGSACTTVAVEFSAPLQGQTSQFAAEVQFHDGALRQFVTDLVEDFRRSLPSMSADDDPEDEDAESKHVNQHHQKTQAENALSLLKGLFRKHAKYKNEKDLHVYLSSEDENSTPGNQTTKIAEELHAYIKDLIRDRCDGNVGNKVLIQADDAKSLNQLLQKFTREFHEDDEPQLWPVVKLVRTGVKDRALLQYITLADLPGINDDNRMRREATHEYLQETDSVWVVAPIHRVLSTKDVHEQIASFEHRMSGRVALVCTFTDDNVTESLYEEIKRKVGSSACADYVSKVQEQASAKVNWDRHFGLYYCSNKYRTPDRKKIDSANLKHAETEHKKAKLETRLALVALRVQFVQSNMRLTNPTLKVFGVSNKYYQRLRCNPPSKHYNRLKASDTGIEQLRHFSVQIPSERYWVTIKEHFNTRIKDFRDAVSIFAQSKESKGREEWKDKFKVPKDSIVRNIDDYYNASMKFFEEEIVSAITKRKSHHIQSALEASRVWEDRPEFNHFVYSKFARNKGVFSTRKVEHQSWNEQLVASIKKELNSHWKTFRDRQEDRRDIFVKTLSMRMLNSMPIDDAADDKPIFIQQFQDLVDRQSDTCRKIIEEDFESFRTAVGQINWAIRGTSNDPYICRHLSDTYEVIGHEHGTGKVSRMYGHMRAALIAKRYSFVDAIAKEASIEFKKTCDKHREDMHAEIKKVIQKLEMNFFTMMEEIPPDEELAKFREDLSEFNEKVLKGMMNNIDGMLKQLQRQYYTTVT